MWWTISSCEKGGGSLIPASEQVFTLRTFLTDALGRRCNVCVFVCVHAIVCTP